jgi:hypothetical protein
VHQGSDLAEVMKVMIVKLRQRGKTIRQISIVLIMVLLIVFLAAPASAVTCAPKYSAYKKVITNVNTETKETLALTYKIPGFKPAVTLRLYVKYQRTATKWQMERTKTTYTYCTKTKKCEISGTPTIQVGTKGTTYGAWVAISYRTTIT